MGLRGISEDIRGPGGLEDVSGSLGISRSPRGHQRGIWSSHGRFREPQGVLRYKIDVSLKLKGLCGNTTRLILKIFSNSTSLMFISLSNRGQCIASLLFTYVIDYCRFTLDE